MLELKDIKKQYTTGGFTQIALNGVNLKFRKSEFAAILGPSGSGKTTLLNIAGGLAQYDSGDLLINGQSTKTFTDSDWDAYRNNSIGFIFQSYNLISHLSILDNVMMGMTLSGVSKEEKQERALKVLEQVGLDQHVHKRPNQLSGGQMQRVAIARSLVNDPDIILADEPTGALDTKTSQQIMELIAEIAKDKLVIMVTHNPELAQEYATRIIEFRDGEIQTDSAPYKGEETNKQYKMKKTSMSFFNALKLSGKNIWTKKWRTALIAFASSIGIIGIALVLSLSNGFSAQIASVESDTLSGFPITISKTASTTSFGPGGNMQSKEDKSANEKQRKSDYIYQEKVVEDNVHENKLSPEYIDYLKKIDPALVSGINYGYNVNFNLLHKVEDQVVATNSEALDLASYPTASQNGQTFLESNFDVLAGSLPKTKNDLILVVGKNNELSESMLTSLGFKKDQDKIALNDFIGREIKSVPNDLYYQETDGVYKSVANNGDLGEIYNNSDNTTLKIVGVLRGKEDIEVSALTNGLKYSDELVQSFITEAKNSKIVKAQEDADFNINTGEPFVEETAPAANGGFGAGAPGVPGMSTQVAPSMTKDQMLMKLGAEAAPNQISIYPINFDSKEQILTYLDKWNKGKKEADKIVYTDLAAMVTSIMGSTLNAITYVLIAFAAISLVVSLIMIGIITYISVMERTKEIGILRALGARKKDITRVFNAETFIIGMVSGLLGIGIAYLLTIPMNIVIENVADLSNVAVLNPLHAAALVVISVLLTMLGGLIPARMAAKKDPVEALSAE